MDSYGSLHIPSKFNSHFQPHQLQVGPVLATCNGAFGMTSAALPLVFQLLRLGVLSVSSTAPKCAYFFWRQHNERKERGMDGWMVGWMDGWIDRGIEEVL